MSDVSSGSVDTRARFAASVRRSSFAVTIASRIGGGESARAHIAVRAATRSGPGVISVDGSELQAHD